MLLHRWTNVSRTDPQLSVRQAAQCIRAGRLVIVPTETVYGLAADALNEDAVAHIFEAKGRPRFNPIICHLPDADAVFRYARHSDIAERLAEFWPGPLTVLLPHEGRIPGIVTAGSPLCGFRVPRHPLLNELLTSCDRPLAAPSANRFGRRSPTTAAMALHDLGDAVAGVLDGGPCEIGVESTVVAVRDGARLEILRPGGVTEEVLRARGFDVIERQEAAGDTGDRSEAAGAIFETIESPGQLSSHYAPGVPLLLISGDAGTGGEERERIEAAVDRLNPGRNAVAYLGYGSRSVPEYCAAAFNLSPDHDLLEAARNLFSFFERIDDGEYGLIVAETLPESGLGRAINDRLRRAATSIVVV